MTTQETGAGANGNEFAPTKEFADLFFLAIDHGFGSIEHGGGPLIPFVISRTVGGEKTLDRFVAERIEDGLERARAHVAKVRESLEMYAIAWDGYVTLANERTDAILVEAGDRGDSNAVLFCQRYRVKKTGLLRRTVAERIGNPGLIGRPESRLS